ncbi:hypothetical protein SUDANB38_04012 [Streptomyces sp. enrichment culture]
MVNDRTSEPEGPRHDAVVCSRCGATADHAPLTWTSSVENGTRYDLCETCAREHIRAIESRLDRTWW